MCLLLQRDEITTDSVGREKYHERRYLGTFFVTLSNYSIAISIILLVYLYRMLQTCV